MPDRGEDLFLTFVPELFEQMGPVRVRRMFGGAGVFAQGRMFALIAEDVIYLKVDEALKARLLAAGSTGPFLWKPESGPKAGQTFEMGYWRLPDSAMDDPDDAAKWGKAALKVALAAAAPKRKRKVKSEPI